MMPLNTPLKGYLSVVWSLVALKCICEPLVRARGAT